MSTQMADSEFSASDSPRPGKRSSWGTSFLLILVIALVGAFIAWKAGALRSKQNIAVITSTDDTYWDRLFTGSEAAARYFDVNIQVIKSKSDTQAQSQIIRDLLAKGIDGLVVSPVNPAAQADLLREAATKAALVTVDSDSPNSNRIAFVGTNNYDAGRQCAEVVKDAIPDGGEIILCVGSIDNDNGRSRREGILDALANRPKDPTRAKEPVDAPIKAGNYTVVTTLIDGADPATAVSMAVDAIKKNPNLKCLVGMWSYNTPALLDALKQTDKLGKIKVVGFDDLEPTLQGVEAGDVFGTLVQDQYNMGFDSVMTLCAALNRNDAVASMQPRTAYLTCTTLLNADEVKMFRSTRDQAMEKKAE